MSKKDERTTNPDATRAIMGGRIDYLSISGDDWFNILGKLLESCQSILFDVLAKKRPEKAGDINSLIFNNSYNTITRKTENYEQYLKKWGVMGLGLKFGILGVFPLRKGRNRPYDEVTLVVDDRLRLFLFYLTYSIKREEFDITQTVTDCKILSETKSYKHELFDKIRKLLDDPENVRQIIFSNLDSVLLAIPAEIERIKKLETFQSMHSRIYFHS